MIFLFFSLILIVFVSLAINSGTPDTLFFRISQKEITSNIRDVEKTKFYLPSIPNNLLLCYIQSSNKVTRRQIFMLKNYFNFIYSTHNLFRAMYNTSEIFHIMVIFIAD